MGLSISTNIGDLEWRTPFILLYFTEFDSFAGILRYSGWR